MRTFKTEVGILTRLRHPNIIEAHALIIDLKAGEAYLELPFIEGGTLREWIVGDASRLQQETVVQISSELLRALAYIHSNGIVHLDVKPDNIMMTAEGVSKLTDFDVSKDVISRTLAVRSTTMVGSPNNQHPLATSIPSDQYPQQPASLATSTPSNQYP